MLPAGLSLTRPSILEEARDRIYRGRDVCATRVQMCVFGKETATGREDTRTHAHTTHRVSEREGEVANIWGSSGRATRALIELYKSLILHPHFPHPAPPFVGKPYSRDLPFAHSCLLFSRGKY